MSEINGASATGRVTPCSCGFERLSWSPARSSKSLLDLVVSRAKAESEPGIGVPSDKAGAQARSDPHVR